MARLKKLNPAKLPFFIEFLDIQELPSIDDSLHHHVFQARLLDQINDLFAIRDAGSHRHGAGDMFASLQRRYRLPCVIRDGRIDVNHVHFGIFE